MAFSLRTLLLFVAFASVCVSASVFYFHTWAGPRDRAIVLQERVDLLFKKNGWQGKATVIFYLERVRIDAIGMNESEMGELLTFIAENTDIKLVELSRFEHNAELNKLYPQFHRLVFQED
jgi:hypothetical protein